MMFGVKESIVIVEADGCGKYAKLLYNLIGTNDDTEEGQIGVADGLVDATIFSERQFADTPISSDQRVVFVGKPKTASDYISAVVTEASNKIEEHGVRVFQSGKQAYVDIDSNNLSKEDYWSFLAFAEEHGQLLPDILEELRTEETALADKPEGGNPLGMIAHVVSNVAQDVARGAADNAAILLKGNELNDQRFRFAVKLFYLEKLHDFVEA